MPPSAIEGPGKLAPHLQGLGEQGIWKTGREAEWLLVGEQGPGSPLSCPPFCGEPVTPSPSHCPALGASESTPPSLLGRRDTPKGQQKLLGHRGDRTCPVKGEWGQQPPSVCPGALSFGF